MSNQLFSLTTAMLVGASASYLGSLVIARKMALVGDALGHVALPGMGIALLLNLDPSLGAFVFLAVAVFLVWKLGELTSFSTEIPVGIIFVASLAAGFLIVPEHELLESLIGDIGSVSGTAAVITGACALAVFGIVRRIYPVMTLISISPDMAQVEGFSVRKYHFIYLATIAVIVSLGVRVTGSLLVGALLIVPPATARMLSRNLKQYSTWSVFLGGMSGGLGILVSWVTGWPAGPAIILVSSFTFASVLGYRAVCSNPLGA